MNCGACGAPCLDDSTGTAVCAGGMCTRTCRPGLASCESDGSCSTELAFSDDHCGRCGVSCGESGHCIAGVCVSLDARPVAPLSTVILGVQRPRFRWERATGVDGVRLQLCADRACSRVESARDLSGDEYRPEVGLSPGVHFWRLFARRGSSVSASPSPVWEFVVPATDSGREITGFLHDLDGDGVEDTSAVVHSLTPGGTESLVGAMHFSGDIDGDGFGDLVGPLAGPSYLGSPATFAGACAMIRGGAPHFAATYVATAVAFTVPPYGSNNLECTFQFDLNGDGYGDITSHSLFSVREYEDRVRFGSRHRWIVPAEEFNWGYPNYYSSMDRGDFNGDGRMDLIHVRRDFFSAIADIGVVSFAGGIDAPARLGAACTAVPERAQTIAYAVLDGNRDGFDDLTLRLEAGASVTYLGGADGFGTDRCLYTPGTP